MIHILRAISIDPADSDPKSCHDNSSVTISCYKPSNSFRAELTRSSNNENPFSATDPANMTRCTLGEISPSSLSVLKSIPSCRNSGPSCQNPPYRRSDTLLGFVAQSVGFNCPSIHPHLYNIPSVKVPNVCTSLTHAPSNSFNFESCLCR